MPAPAERSRYGLVVHGFLALLLTLAAIPAYLTLAPAWRPLAVRLACAVLVVAGCLRVMRGVRRALGEVSTSALDAPPFVSGGPELDDRFLRLRDELVFSGRSLRYFDAILWPRLLRLAGADLPRPAEPRGTRRRGPSLSTLEHLIAEVERRA